jgi:starch synthase
LLDTIVDADVQLETGTGFLFDEATVDAVVGGVQRAVAARELPRWRTLVRRAMRLDHGWDGPARRYEQVYRNLLAG